MAGRVTITIDDGYDSQVGFFNYLTSVSKNGVMFADTKRIGRAGFLTEAEVLTIQGQGHEIANHGVWHKAVKQTSFDVYMQEVDAAQTFWEAAPYSVTPTTHAYPVWDTLPPIKKRLSDSSDLRCARAGAEGQTTLNELTPAADDCWQLYSYGIAGDSLATLKGVVDTAKSENKWLIFTTHHTSQISQVNFDALVDYIIEQEVPITTIADIITTQQSFSDTVNQVTIEESAGVLTYTGDWTTSDPAFGNASPGNANPGIPDVKFTTTEGDKVEWDFTTTDTAYKRVKVNFFKTSSTRIMEVFLDDVSQGTIDTEGTVGYNADASPHNVGTGLGTDNRFGSFQIDDLANGAHTVKAVAYADSQTDLIIDSFDGWYAESENPVPTVGNNKARRQAALAADMDEY